MEFLPSVRLGIPNGWLLLAANFVGLTISAIAFPVDKRRKLFIEPHYPRGHPRLVIIALGRIAAISFVVLTPFASLKLGTYSFYLGLAVYAIGYIVVMVSMHDYKRAPTTELATTGLYRYSRNPQWLGLVGVFAGTALAVGGWLHLILVFLLVIAYHFQILLEEGICKAAYGAEYLDYMSRVPRYLFV
jgi:protein-S-isoprenylcysteine O-methyltransferase Ste14